MTVKTPLLDCFIKIGKTEPLLPNTFPYLTTAKQVFPIILFAVVKSLSEQSLVAPYKFIGEQALSVERAITFLILFSLAALTIFSDPRILVLINS